MAKFLITGKTFGLLNDYIESRDDEWILVKDSKINSGYSKKKKNTYFCDLSSEELTKAGMSSFTDDIDGIVNTYEAYIEATTWLGEILDLPAINHKAAKACSDKYLMRQKFSTAPEKINPDFDLIDSWNTVQKFAENHDFPLIIKPTGLSKSLLVTKNDNLEELKTSYDQVMSEGESIYKKYSPNKEPRFIVEEFMVGHVYSVDGYADSNGGVVILDNVVDYETGYEVGYDDNYHYSRILPSRLSQENQQAIRHVAELGMKALGMTNSPAHVEVILTEEGPRIVEIGARNGGYRERMHKLANGIDTYGAMIDVATGKEVSVDSTKNDFVAVLEIFPREKGTFSYLKNESVLRSLESLNDLRVVPKKGDIVGKSSQGYKMAARVVLHTSDKKTFESDLDYIKNNVEVVIEN